MKVNNSLIGKIKQEFLQALGEDVEFKEKVQKKLGVPTNNPFIRDREMEREKIEKAIANLNFKAIAAAATLMSEYDDTFEGSIYFNENECEKSIRNQLEKSFDLLFSEFPNVTVHYHAIGGDCYSFSIDGAFSTMVEYYKLDDGTWEPAVSVRFCPIEYIEY